jgi:hypothetical protein
MQRWIYIRSHVSTPTLHTYRVGTGAVPQVTHGVKNARKTTEAKGSTAEVGFHRCKTTYTQSRCIGTMFTSREVRGHVFELVWF